jgi:hypothetical protein
MKTLMPAICFLLGFCLEAKGSPLGLQITTDRDSMTPRPLLWTVVLTNPDSKEHNDVVLSLTLPSGVRDPSNEDDHHIDPTFFNPTPDDGLTYGGVFGDYVRAGTTITYQVGHLPPGSNRVFQVTTTPSSTATVGDLFTMSAQAESSSQGSFAFSERTLVAQNSDLNMTLSADSLALTTNAPTLVTVAYGSSSSTPIANAKIEVSLPSGFTVKSGTAGYKISGYLVTWDLGTIFKRDNGRLSLTLNYSGTQPPGSILQLKADLKSSLVTKASSTILLATSVSHGLKLQISTTAPRVLPAKSITWKVLLTNTRTIAATGVQLRVMLPCRMMSPSGQSNDRIDLSFLNPQPDDGLTYGGVFGDFARPGTVMTYNVGTLLAGSSRIYQITCSPSSGVADYHNFIMTAQCNSDNGIEMGFAEATLTFGELVLIVPDIAIEQPLGVEINDNQRQGSNFGFVKRGSSKAKTYLIINNGRATLNNIQISKHGKNTNNWVIEKPLKSMLGPGERTSFRVRFRPIGTGSRTCHIKIRSNDPTENPFDIFLRGRAKQ